MRLIEQFFRVLAPANCLECGQEGDILCVWCRDNALPEVFARCYKCNKLSPGSRTCTACRRNSPIRHLWYRTEYLEIARKLVHEMKFSYSKEAAELIAAEILNTLPVLPPETIVSYVPAATSHVRQRGFDHAAEIARVVAKSRRHAFLPLLSRQGQARQVGATRMQRISQMENAFIAKTSQITPNTKVLLIDDVLTTGATIEAASKVLKAAGVKTIDVAIFARAR